MDNKKIAAATAAVFTYIKTQEEAAYYASQAETGNEVETPVEMIETDRTSKFSSWANAGRLNQMQQNSMMLMKVR
ncbi:MAG: hypothetical protein KAJ62_07000 [Desulfobacteraceae bacterium]|nr:hypothetical protein [Desulfobacteraceae bacterium]